MDVIRKARRRDGTECNQITEDIKVIELLMPQKEIRFCLLYTSSC